MPISTVPKQYLSIQFFHLLFSKHKEDIYKCFNNLLLICVPFHVVDSGLQGDDLIIIEAISNSQDKCCSGFLCIFALSSVISRNIISFCPSFVETRYKALFNKKIERHIPLKALPSVDDVYILFCFNGLIKGNFEPNHSNCLLYILYKAFQLLNNKIINFETNVTICCV